MKIVVGLGNPGPKYETTRHNVGFLALDRLIERWHAGTAQKKHHAELFSASFGGEKVTLVKPETFMNLSGRSVASLFGFYKCVPEDVIIIHDELDLKPVSFRLKVGGGTGGHNGLKSIDECLGAGQNGYHRVRIGIGHPAALGLRQQPVDYVLGQFSDQELAELDPLFDRVAEAIEMLVRGDAKGAMNKYNQKEK